MHDNSLYSWSIKDSYALTGGKLWWADDDLAQLGTVAKRDGRSLVALRNKTSGVVHMKVYDREGQKGELPSDVLKQSSIFMKRSYFEVC